MKRTVGVNVFDILKKRKLCHTSPNESLHRLSCFVTNVFKKTHQARYMGVMRQLVMELSEDFKTCDTYMTEVHIDLLQSVPCHDYVERAHEILFNQTVNEGVEYTHRRITTRRYRMLFASTIDDPVQAFMNWFHYENMLIRNVRGMPVSATRLFIDNDDDNVTEPPTSPFSPVNLEVDENIYGNYYDGNLYQNRFDGNMSDITRFLFDE